MEEEVRKKIVDYMENQAPVVFILLNEDGKIVEINDYASKVLGEGIIGNDVRQIFVDFDDSLDIG